MPLFPYRLISSTLGPPLTSLGRVLAFAFLTVSVNDASGANAKDYNVYVKDLASPQGSTTKYQVTI